MDTQELIAWLEISPEGSRELSRLIAEREGTIIPPHEEVHIESRSYSVHREAFPNYTESVDAALTLVPQGLEIRLDKLTDIDDANPWEYCCDLSGNGVSRRSTDTKAKSFPLAICIAALRARMASE